VQKIVRIISILDRIRIGCLFNKDVERYRYIKLLVNENILGKHASITHITGNRLTMGEGLAIAQVTLKYVITRRKANSIPLPPTELLRPFRIGNGLICPRGYHSADVDIEERFGRISYPIILCLLTLSNGWGTVILGNTASRYSGNTLMKLAHLKAC
jgi:hypothetical protein